MPGASENTTSLGGQPSVTVRQYTSAAANLASREIARNNYRYRSMNDTKLQQLRQILYRRVQSWAQSDKINILVEYGFQVEGVNPKDINALVVEALIIYMSEPELESLLNSMMADEQRMERRVKGIEAKTKQYRKGFKNKFSNLSFNDAYNEYKRKKRKQYKDPGKNIKKFLKKYDKGFKVNKRFISSFKALQTEMLRVLKELYDPTDLYGIATEMGIEVDDMMSVDQVSRLITEKTLLYVALVTGKTKGVSIYGAFSDPGLYNEVLKYTSFAWITGSPGLSLGQLKAIRTQAKLAKAKMKARENVVGKAKKKHIGYKKALKQVTGQKGRLTKRSMKHNNDVGVLAGMTVDELVQTAAKYGIEVKNPAKVDTAELRVQIYQKMASAQRIYSRLNKKASKARAKGQIDKAERLEAEAKATRKAMRLTRGGMNDTETLQGTPIVRLAPNGQIKNKILMAVPVIIAGQVDPATLNKDDNGEIDIMDKMIDPENAVKKKRKRADRIDAMLGDHGKELLKNGNSMRIRGINKILDKAEDKYGSVVTTYEAESDDGVTPKFDSNGNPIIKTDKDGNPVLATTSTPNSLKITKRQLAGMSHRQLRKVTKKYNKTIRKAMILKSKGKEAAFNKLTGKSFDEWDENMGPDPLKIGRTIEPLPSKSMESDEIQRIHVALEDGVYHKSGKDSISSGLNVWVLNWPANTVQNATSPATTPVVTQPSILKELSEKPNPDRELADYVKTGTAEVEVNGKKEKMSNALRMELAYAKEYNLKENKDYVIKGKGDKRHCYFLNHETGKFTVYYSKKNLRDMMYVDKEGKTSATKGEKFLGRFSRSLKESEIGKSNVHHTKGNNGFKTVAAENKKRLDALEKAADGTKSYVEISSDLLLDDAVTMGFKAVKASKENSYQKVTPWVQPVFLVNKEVPVDVTAFSCISKILEGLASSLLSALTGGISSLFFAKGGTGTARANKKSSFISGDSLNGKPNEERVDIDWQRRQYKVTPIAKLAKGGTGTALSDKTTSLNSSTGSSPLSVTLADNLISYSNKLSGDDGSGKALKVYMVNNPLTEELSVNGSSGTLAEMLNTIGAQLSTIAQLMASSNEYSSAIATETAAVGVAVNNLAASTSSSSGSSFESGFTDALDGILQGA